MIKWLLYFAVFLFVGVFSSAYAACEFTNSDDIADVFKNCNPEIGIKTDDDITLEVTDSSSDFREVSAEIIERVQIIASIIAIGLLVWIGIILVSPVNAEAKESAKSKVFSVVLGFLLMIAATVIVNGLINIIYEVFE